MSDNNSSLWFRRVFLWTWDNSTWTIWLSLCYPKLRKTHNSLFEEGQDKLPAALLRESLIIQETQIKSRTNPGSSSRLSAYYWDLAAYSLWFLVLFRGISALLCYSSMFTETGIYERMNCTANTIHLIAHNEVLRLKLFFLILSASTRKIEVNFIC